MQKGGADCDINPVIKKYFGQLSGFKCCVKDFVKAMNVPFAYNLARYKNLSIDALFDKNGCL